MSSVASAASDDGAIVITFSHMTKTDKHPKGIAVALLQQRANGKKNGTACMDVFPNSTIHFGDKVHRSDLPRIFERPKKIACKGRMHPATRPEKVGVIDHIEETLIVPLLGLMAAATLADVLALFMNSNRLWALEATIFMFGRLLLLGASYAVKKNSLLGVDQIAGVFVCMLVAALSCPSPAPTVAISTIVIPGMRQV